MSTALRPGDYLQIASERMAVDGVPDGEGFARIERVEIITDIGFLAPDSTPRAYPGNPADRGRVL
ncbi:hypothetical protein [Streptomyces sp. NPDC012510]|uniref:hypothetical protein n=1 Tax=Streptomyces sp. NPDC012510 TaxID=3364838 RepID=UPI0036E4E961